MSNLSIELLSIYTKSMQSKKHFAVVRVLADSGHRNKLVCTSCVSAMIYVLFEWQKLPKEFYNTYTFNSFSTIMQTLYYGLGQLLPPSALQRFVGYRHMVEGNKSI